MATWSAVHGGLTRLCDRRPDRRQPVNHGRGAVRAGQLSLSQSPVASILPGITGEEDGQGSQVRQDLILANVGVLRPGRIGDRGAGVAEGLCPAVASSHSGHRRGTGPRTSNLKDIPRILIPGDGAAGDQEAQNRPACPAMAATRHLRPVPSQRLPGAMVSGAPAVLNRQVTPTPIHMARPDPASVPRGHAPPQRAHCLWPEQFQIADSARVAAVPKAKWVACRLSCSARSRYSYRIAVAVGAFLAGVGLGGGRSGLAVDACLCGVGSARLARVAGRNEDAAVGAGPPRPWQMTRDPDGKTPAALRSPAVPGRREAV